VTVVSRCALAAAVIGLAALAQRPFRTYTPMEGRDSEAEIPADFAQKTEFVLGRLMYPSTGGGGRRGASWTVDYPRGDRTFAVALRRLTRVEVRSVEQPVDLADGNDIFYWPYLHAGMPTAWTFNDEQARKMRDYLLRGGFLVCDSFFGTQEWQGFERGMKQIFPNREIVDLPDDDPIFHAVFALREKTQVGTFRSRGSGRWYRADGDKPIWRGVRDDRGRVMVAINFNNDLGDSWQLADNPEYPEKFSSMGIRLGVNYVVYSLTH
jgi:hypothetical protein